MFFFVFLINCAHVYIAGFRNTNNTDRTFHQRITWYVDLFFRELPWRYITFYYRVTMHIEPYFRELIYLEHYSAENQLHRSLIILVAGTLSWRLTLDFPGLDCHTGTEASIQKVSHIYGKDTFRRSRCLKKNKWVTVHNKEVSSEIFRNIMSLNEAIYKFSVTEFRLEDQHIFSFFSAPHKHTTHMAFSVEETNKMSWFSSLLHIYLSYLMWTPSIACISYRTGSPCFLQKWSWMFSVICCLVIATYFNQTT